MKAEDIEFNDEKIEGITIDKKGVVAMVVKGVSFELFYDELEYILEAIRDK